MSLKDCVANTTANSNRQIEIIAAASPKRHYYYQSSIGDRLFELGLGPLALGLCGSSSPGDQALIDRLLAASPHRFAERFFAAKNLGWAAEFIRSQSLSSPQSSPQGEFLCAAE